MKSVRRKFRDALTEAEMSKLSATLLKHLAYKFENPDEALLKEVWEECKDEVDAAFIDGLVQGLAIEFKDRAENA